MDDADKKEGECSYHSTLTAHITAGLLVDACNHVTPAHNPMALLDTQAACFNLNSFISKSQMTDVIASNKTKNVLFIITKDQLFTKQRELKFLPIQTLRHLEWCELYVAINGARSH